MCELAFSPLSREHLEQLRAVMAPFPPYSDFDATSLWSWSVEGTTEGATPPGGFVVRTVDYVTGEKTIWAVASANADAVIGAAWKEACRTMDEPAVSLVPEHSIQLLTEPERFTIEHNRDEDGRT